MKLTLISLFTSMALAQSAGTFTATSSMSVPRVGHTATLLNNGKVLICGGSSRYDSLGTLWASAELYDPMTGTFAATGDMTTLRQGHTATLLPNGKVLIAGGIASPNGARTDLVLSSAELYDPASETFTATGNMSDPRVGHTATLLNNGKVLICGGSFLDTADVYDPSTGTFTRTGNMTIDRGNHTASLLPDGKVLIASGNGHTDGAIPWVEVYDPDAGTFSRAGAAGAEDTFGPAIISVLTTGQVLISLNFSLGNFSTTGRAKLYDPAGQVFTDTGNMRAPRFFTATLLPTRKVLIAGRSEPYSPESNGFPSAALYDPDTGAFSATGEMITPRFNDTATLLPDGSVLVTGGMTSFSSPSAAALATAEIYHPDVLVPAAVLLSVSQDRQGAILHADTHQLVSTGNPAVANEPLEVYCTGLDDGSVIPPQVTIGGRMAEVLWFGKAPGYANLNQVNVRVSSGIAPGPAVPVRLTYLSRPSNEVTISLQ